MYFDPRPHANKVVVVPQPPCFPPCWCDKHSPVQREDGLLWHLRWYNRQNESRYPVYNSLLRKPRESQKSRRAAAAGAARGEGVYPRSQMRGLVLSYQHGRYIRSSDYIKF